jgi:hypothetical protein
MGNFITVVWGMLGRKTEEKMKETKKLMEIGLRQAQTRVRDDERAIEVVTQDLDEMVADTRTSHSKRLAKFKELQRKKADLKRNKMILMKEELEQSTVGRVLDSKNDMKRQMRLDKLKKQLELTDTHEVRKHVTERIKTHAGMAEAIHALDQTVEMENDAMDFDVEIDAEEDDDNEENVQCSKALQEHMEQRRLEMGMAKLYTDADAPVAQSMKADSSKLMAGRVMHSDDVMLELESVN